MISGQPGQRPDLLRQWELGTVPKEMAGEEANKPEDSHGEEHAGETKRRRRRWHPFWRRH